MSAISRGDLVIVLRGHCVHVAAGLPKTVLEVMRTIMTPHCLRCDESFHINEPTALIQHDGYEGWLPVSWLKKIEPPAVLDAIDREQPAKELV